VDKVSFAGPVSVGRRIAVACGETFKSVNLDLGGKSAAIVPEDADLEATSAALGRLAFANSGQACFAASRVLAPRGRYDEAVTGLMEQAAAMVVGDPMMPETSASTSARSASTSTCPTLARPGAARPAARPAPTAPSASAPT
jgi:aldehyde dehydrogenase (NAD+)